MKDTKFKEKNRGPYQYYNQFKKINFIDLIDHSKSSSDRIKSIQVVLSEMMSTVRMLENEYRSFQLVNDNKLKTEHLNEIDDLKRSSLSSNGSLNSNSFGYLSKTTDESGYSSEEITKIHIKNDHINTQKNDELKNKKTENTETPQKKTYSVVKSKKKTLSFSGTIFTTRATALRDKKISNKFNFKLNENSQKKILNDGKLNTKKFNASFDEMQKKLYDINVLGEEIVNEEANYAMLKTELAKLK